MSYELREEARRRDEERQRLLAEQEQLLRDMRAVVSTSEGARVFAWLIEQGNIFAEDYAPGAAGAYSAGKKMIALRLWKMLGSILPPEELVRVIGARADEAAVIA